MWRQKGFRFNTRLIKWNCMSSTVLVRHATTGHEMLQTGRRREWWSRICLIIQWMFWPFRDHELSVEKKSYTIWNSASENASNNITCRSAWRWWSVLLHAAAHLVYSIIPSSIFSRYCTTVYIDFFIEPDQTFSVAESSANYPDWSPVQHRCLSASP